MTFAPKHLLVPVDVDPLSDRELATRLVEDAVSLAKTCGAKITLLHVALPAVIPAIITPDATATAFRAMNDVVEARNAQSLRALRELEKRIGDAGVPVKIELVTKMGSVPELILEMAKDVSADLVVLSTHARRGVKRVFLGSVAEKTAHLAHVPVLLLPPR